MSCQEKYNTLFEQNKQLSEKFQQANTNNQNKNNLDKFNSMIDQATAAISCDSECQNQQKDEQLKQAYLDAQTNLATAPNNVYVSRQNYVVFDQGQPAYDELIDSELLQQAQKLTSYYQNNFTDESQNIIFNTNTYSGLLLNLKNIFDLFLIYKEENIKLLKKIKRIDIYSYLYPMMSFPIPYWFFFNGYKGFIEHQIIIPKEHYEPYFFELKNLFYKHRMQAYNSFLKLFNGKRNNLRFDGSGIAFSIEFLNDKKSHDFLKLVDEINCKYGAITAVYKDSRISKKTVIKQYGEEFHKFEKFIKRIDPKNFIKSNFKNKFFNSN
jgi:hypothetical protein